MSDLKATPGPWEIDQQELERHDRLCIITAIDEEKSLAAGKYWDHFDIICDFEAATPETDEQVAEVEANARLIAGAPDLYEALVAIHEMLWARADIVNKLRPLMGPAEDAVSDQCAAALAKARGQ